LINYKRIEALLIVVVVIAAFVMMVVSSVIVKGLEISADHCTCAVYIEIDPNYIDYH